MICNRCKNEIKADDMFCGKCGTKVFMQNSQTEFNNATAILIINPNLPPPNLPRLLSFFIACSTTNCEFGDTGCGC